MRLIVRLVLAIPGALLGLMLLLVVIVMRLGASVPQFFDRHPAWPISKGFNFLLRKIDGALISWLARLRTKDIVRRIRNGEWPWHAQ